MTRALQQYWARFALAGLPAKILIVALCVVVPCLIIAPLALLALPGPVPTQTVYYDLSEIDADQAVIGFGRLEPAAGQSPSRVQLRVPPRPEPQTALPGEETDAEEEDPTKLTNETKELVDAGPTESVSAEPNKTPPTVPARQEKQLSLSQSRSIQGYLLEDVAGLALPTVGADGKTPFEAYRARNPLAAEDERARIALVVTGLGLSTARSELAFEQLPQNVTIALSPYSGKPQRWVDLAFETGREVLMMVPMEPNSFPTVDPGPDTLMRDAPEIQTITRLHRVLSQAQGYMGIINDTGSRFTANAIAVAPVLDDLKTRGLMVVDARASAYSVLAKEARKRDIPTAINTRFIDSSLAPEDINRQLRDLERTAQTIGAALGIMRALPVSIDAVANWEAARVDTDTVLVPVSAIANLQPIR